MERSTNRLWGAHFPVPANVASKLKRGTDRRVICTLNDSVEYQCALLPHGGGTFVISVNKQTRDKLKLLPGDPIRVKLVKDVSRYGLPLPDELKEVFRQDADGSRLFHALTLGRQRTLLYIVGRGSTSERRAVRGLTILDHLKLNKGKIRYRELSLALRKREAVGRGRFR